MEEKIAAFSGFSVKDIDEAQRFYKDLLGLAVEKEGIGLRIQFPDGGSVFAYPKGDHQPAPYTMLNLEVKDIDAAVEALKDRGVTFERYDGMPQDEKGIMRGKAQKMGPDIAWFRDPSGNVIAVLAN